MKRGQKDVQRPISGEKTIRKLKKCVNTNLQKEMDANKYITSKSKISLQSVSDGFNKFPEQGYSIKQARHLYI